MSEEFYNVQSNRKVISSLWTTLCAQYEGTNIKNTIVQLLNKYRPEDGINAYEKLLKTLIILLNDCNNNDLRSFTSMIPSPNGYSEKLIKESFFNATGFMRINGPVLNKDYFYFPYEKSVMKNDKSKQINMFEYSAVEANDFVNSDTVTIPEIINQHVMFSQKPSTDCHSFEEIKKPSPTVYIHDNNIQYPHHLSCNSYPNQQCAMKHQENSLYIPSINCPKTWSLNQVPLFVKNCNTIPSNLSCRSLLVKTIDNKYLRLPVSSSNAPDVHYFNYYQNHESSEKEENSLPAYDLLNNTSKLAIEVSGDPNDVEYKKSLKKRELNDFKEYNCGYLQKESVESNNESENYLFYQPFADNILDTLTVNKNLRGCIKNLTNRLKQDILTQEPTDKTQKTNASIETGKASFSHHRRTISVPFSQKKHNLQNQSKTINSSSVYQINSMNELTAHKQQYYDALLNVQRAKMAVANSLTFSSAQTYGDSDSFFTNYGQQRHWTTHQPQAKTIHELPNRQKLYHSQYSHANNPYIRVADWNSYSDSRIRQESSLTHASSVHESRYMYNVSNDVSQYPDFSSRSKTPAKKRKLNNSNVKLTKNDTESMHY